MTQIFQNVMQSIMHKILEPWFAPKSTINTHEKVKKENKINM